VRKLKWLLLALALYLCAELYVSNSLLQTERLTVYRSDLPQAFDGFTVCALSDAHAKRFGGGNRDLLSAVREASPDIIVLTGDLAECPDELPYAQELCEGLLAIAPTYYVTGNHEWGADWSALRKGEPRFTPELFVLLDDCGVQRLDNQTLELRRGGDSLWLCGLRDPNGPSGGQTPRQLVARAEGGFTILLSHRYDRLDEYA
jgi:predicted MPP superfamily phosphohydrolase